MLATSLNRIGSTPAPFLGVRKGVVRRPPSRVVGEDIRRQRLQQTQAALRLSTSRQTDEHHLIVETRLDFGGLVEAWVLG